jgi:hypothetical protein
MLKISDFKFNDHIPDKTKRPATLSFQFNCEKGPLCIQTIDLFHASEETPDEV